MPVVYLIYTAIPKLYYYGSFVSRRCAVPEWPVATQQAWDEGADVVAYAYGSVPQSIDAFYGLCVEAFHTRRNCLVVRHCTIAAEYTYRISAFVRESPHPAHLFRFVGPFAEAEFVQGALAYRGMLCDDVAFAPLVTSGPDTLLERVAWLTTINQDRARKQLPPLVSASTLADMRICAVRDAALVRPLLEQVVAEKVLSETTAWATYLLQRDAETPEARQCANDVSLLVQETFFNVLPSLEAQQVSRTFNSVQRDLRSEVDTERCERALDLYTKHMSPFRADPALLPSKWAQNAFTFCAQEYVARADFKKLIALYFRAPDCVFSLEKHVADTLVAAMRAMQAAQHSFNAADDMAIGFAATPDWHPLHSVSQIHDRIAAGLIEAGFNVIKDVRAGWSGMRALFVSIAAGCSEVVQRMRKAGECRALVVLLSAPENGTDARSLYGHDADAVALLSCARYVVAFSQAQRSDAIARYGRWINPAKIVVLPLFAPVDTVDKDGWQIQPTMEAPKERALNIFFESETYPPIMEGIIQNTPKARFAASVETAHLYVNAQVNERTPWAPLNLIDAQVYGATPVCVDTGAIGEYTKIGHFFKGPSTNRATVDAIVTRATELLRRYPHSTFDRRQTPYELFWNYAVLEWSAFLRKLVR